MNEQASETLGENKKSTEEKTRNSSRAMSTEKIVTITTTSGITHTHRSTDNNSTNKNQVFVRTNLMIFMNEIFFVLIDLMVESTIYAGVNVCLGAVCCVCK